MATVLRAAGLYVEVHDDHFRQDALDPEWLTAVGEKNWIVVTRDERIRYNVAEKQALRRAKVQGSFWQRRAIYEQRCWQRFFSKRFRRFGEQ